ncbi:MAG TPA: substrate-binding domain-containing protein [Xanthobacteraceae bacterium]|nr:substrate-binding domain-containing protein [Xanthobacteraceae bacterium]HUN99266.1 substrate-binding domain-containing protein [Bradyrhizobium sp.]
MFSNCTRQLLLGAAASAAILITSFTAYAGSPSSPPRPRTTNINLAVASNFYGVPPSNSAITDIINAFEAENPNYTVTVTDNGATSTLEMNIINGNKAKVDLFLAADTATPLDLYLNHFTLTSPYNSPGFSFNGISVGSSNNLFSFTPPLYMFNYATGVLAFLSNTPGVDVTCDAGGTCGYSTVYSTVAIADPALAPYGVAAQTVLTGRYGLMPPLSSNPAVREYPNITATLNAVLAKTDPVGFVALSAICSNGQYPTQGTSALAYFSIEGGATPGTIVNNYNPLTQAGIAINKRRTAAQNTELTDFVAFMTDFATSPSPDSPMVTTLKKYCYNAP